jgi:hypothetical protein
MYIRILLLFLSFIFIGISCKSHKLKQLEKDYELSEKKEKNKLKHSPTLAEVIAETITSDDLDYHVYNLAADTMKGRESGTQGGELAAQYLKDFFIDEQILFPMEIEGFFQNYTVTENNMPVVTFETDISTYQYGKDFISFFPHDTININQDKIIYGGYGIEDYKYNDYAYQDVKNKIVLITGGEPKDSYGNYIISGGKTRSEWSADPIHSYILKRKAALKHGAKALLIYDPENKEYFWRNFQKKFQNKKLSVSAKYDSLYDFFISKEMFAGLTGYDNPEDMSYDRKSRKLSVPVKIYYKNTNKVKKSKNVIGWIEGGNKKEEYIVVISHYDGLGEKDGTIYPGANDNASGVAASLEIAEAFRSAIDSGFVPKRSIVFIHFSGKEEGMLGSKFYLKHPIFPLEQTKAVVELHQLGRLKNEEEIGEFFPVYIGFDHFDKYDIKKEIEEIHSYNDHIKIHYNAEYAPSDFLTFKNEGIPVIYYYGGSSKDYHKPTDTPDNVSYEVLNKRTNFIFQILWKIANDKKL